MDEKFYKMIFLWDIGNVLVRFVEKDFLEELIKNKRPCFSDEEFINNYKRIISSSFLGEFSLYSTWENLYTLVELQEKHFERIKTRYRIIRNLELINFIKNKLYDYRIGFVSDLHQIAYYYMQRNCKAFLNRYPKELCFFSNQVGFSKHVHGYNYLNNIFNSIDTDKKKIIFIDDSQINIDLAENCGVQTIRFEGYIRNSFNDSNTKIIKIINKIINEDCRENN